MPHSEIYFARAVEKRLRNSGVGGRFGRSVHHTPVVVSVTTDHFLRSTGDNTQ